MVLIQREGEDPDQCHFKAFLCTSDRDELEAMTEDYPDRWHIEPFFKNYQDLGWKVAGTRNLHIRFGKMTLALAAQAACAMLRERLGPPHQSWDAAHLARDLFGGLDGDIRVCDDTIVVTYYNAPNRHRLRKYYENLPKNFKARASTHPSHGSTALNSTSGSNDLSSSIRTQVSNYLALEKVCSAGSVVRFPG